MTERDPKIGSRGIHFEAGADIRIGVTERSEGFAVEGAGESDRGLGFEGRSRFGTIRCDLVRHGARNSKGRAELGSFSPCERTLSCFSARSYWPEKHSNSKRKVLCATSWGLSRSQAPRAANGFRNPAGIEEIFWVGHLRGITETWTGHQKRWPVRNSSNVAAQ